MVLTTAAVFCQTSGVLANPIQENITATTYIDSRNNTQNMSTSKIKLVANALGTGSNDGSITRGLLSLPADLESIPASEIASAKIYFYNYGISPPNYSQPNPPAYTMPDVVLHPLTQSFTYTTATWNSAANGTAWSTPWTTPYSSGGVSGPFESSVSATAVDVNTGGKSTANNWSYFDVTSLWSDPDFLKNGVVMMFSNEVVPLDPNYPSNHMWLTENWANQNWVAPPGGIPYIVVTTVPEPSTLALGLSGVAALGLALGRRRVRKQG
jgi:hypothetical protein